jgi:hypothetical protein
MIRHFICFANSKKTGGRCIAGIEILFDREKKSYSLITDDGKPRWIRPISNADHGEVPTELVKGILLRNIVEVDVTEDGFGGYQSENVKFNLSSLKKVGNITVSEKILDRYSENDETNVFGNGGKAVHPDDISSLNKSIVLLKVEKPVIHKVTTQYNGKTATQHRMKFDFKGHEYDFSLTDPHFIERYEADNNVLDSGTAFYLTISLGVLYMGWYSKLVAGVIMI